MNPALLTQGVSQTQLSGAGVTGGTIVISASSNANLYAILMNNLRNLHDKAEFHH